MSSDPELIGTVQSVQGDSITILVSQESAPGLTFSKGHGYQVGQVGAFVRIPLGLIDLFAIVVQVGSTQVVNKDDAVSDDLPHFTDISRSWMKLELLGEAPRSGEFRRGIGQYPAIGDRAYIVTSHDIGRLYRKDDKSGAIRIGHIANAVHIPALLDVSKLVTRHSAVVGSTGSGKSTTVAALLNAIADKDKFPSARIMIIDVHGEYSTAFKDNSVTYRIDTYKNSRIKQKKLFIPFWALNFEEFVELAFGFIDDSNATVVQSMVTKSKQNYAANHPELGILPNEVTADTPLPFNIKILWMELHELHFATHDKPAMNQSVSTRAYESDDEGNLMVGDAQSVIAPTYKPQTSGGADRIYLSGSTLNMRKQVNLLGAYLRDSRYDFIFKPGEWEPDVSGEVEKDLDALIEGWVGGVEPIMIADLSGVPNQILQEVVSALLRVTYDALIWGRMLPEGGRERPLLIVLEEAHRYLGEKSTSAGLIVERIVKEGRKFGIGAMIVSQRPSEIRSTVISQLGTFVILRMTNNADQSLIKSSLPDNLSGIFDTVPVLRTGEALAIGESTHLPMRMQIESDTLKRPDSTDPVLVNRNGPPGGWDQKKGSENYSGIIKAWRKTSVGDQNEEGDNEMNREPVESSNISTIGYDVNTSTLEIEFKDASVYQYFDVPEAVYEGLMSASSKGSYLNSEIKNSYRYSRI